MTTQTIPAAIAEVMKQRGIKKVPLPNDFSNAVRMHDMMMPEPQSCHPRILTTKETLALFSFEESMEMVYLPHFLMQCIGLFIDRLRNALSGKRKSCFKRHSRILRDVAENYDRQLRQQMPHMVYERFLSQKEEYLQMCATNLSIIYFTFANEMCRKFRHIEDEEIYCWANITMTFCEHIYNHDREVNRKIRKKMDCCISGNDDPRIVAIMEVCRDIAGEYAMQPTEHMILSVRVLENHAMTMVKRIIGEANENRQKSHIS